jgi:hypothetical protein
MTDTEHCILVPKYNEGSLLSYGFHVVGPFKTEHMAENWAKANIIDTRYDNPNWIVMPLTRV